MRKLCLMLLISLPVTICFASSVTVKLYQTSKDSAGISVGSIEFRDITLKTDHGIVSGVLILPDLYQLPPGEHGFHIHVNPSCANNGLAAGGHLDPQHRGKHLGPYDDKGHLGDLPLLYVNQKGEDHTTIFAPSIQVKDILGHSLMIHQHGDNYSDSPQALGGGGARIACGVIQ